VSPVGIVVTAVGGAVTLAGAALGALALTDSESAREPCSGVDCPADARDGIADAQTLANASDVLLFGGLAVAAAGVVLILALTDGGEQASASAMCTSRGCMAAVGGSF